ncbi:MAG: TrkA C-terminal domain-containing protein, partial [Chthoniobacterales bacterium]
AVVGRRISRLRELSQVTITRLERNGIELIPNSSLTLQIGDLLMVVGENEDLDDASAFLGNSAKSLQHLEVGPMFVGIAFGVLLGSIPVFIPGIPAAVKLGLAGGPLILGMIVSHFGKVGRLVFFMPPNANLMLRETGILIFLACVGLKAGAHFWETLVHGPGLLWMCYGVLVTLVPLLLAGVLGRLFLRLNYLTLTGTLAGSMTDPPALAFANSLTKFNGPALAYATVYPLTMVLRLISAQILILVFGP